MEHILRCDNKAFLPFARSKLESIKRIGLEHCTQNYTIGDTTVRIRKSGVHRYIDITQGGVAYEFFTTGDKQSREYLVGWQPLTDATGANAGWYRGYGVKVTLGSGGKFLATPTGSTIEASPESKWPYSETTNMAQFMWSKVWQVNGITEPIHIPKDKSLPALMSTWGAFTGYYSFGNSNPTTLRQTIYDVDFDCPQVRVAKGISKGGSSITAPEGTDWYRRAGVCRVSGRVFIVATDVLNNIFVYPDAAPRSSGYPSYVAAKYVRKIPVQLPTWNNNNSNDAHKARFVNWAFNGNCTKFAGVIERKVWEPTETEGFHVANGLGGSGRVICGGLVLAHGWAEYRLDISVTGERLEDFTVTAALERDEDPLQSGLQTLDIDYAVGVFVPKKEDDKPPCGWKEDDLLLMQVGLYESKKFEVNPTWGGGKFDWSNGLNEGGNGVADYRAIPDIDSALRGSMTLPPPKLYFEMHLTGLRAQYVKTVVTVKNVTTSAMLRTFTIGENRDATSFFATRIASWDLRAMAFLVTVQVLRGTSGEPLERGRSWYEWVGDGAPVTEGLTQSVDFIGMQNYQSRERVYNTGTGGRVELRNEFATGMLVAVIIGNEIDESTQWLGDDYARPRAESILSTKITTLTTHTRDAYDRGVYTSNWLLHVVTTYCDPLEQDKFQIDKSGSWSLATLPFTTSNYASVGNVGAAAKPQTYAISQCVIDVIAIKNGAKWVRTTHREMFNKAYGKSLTEADLLQVPELIEYVDNYWGTTTTGWSMKPPRCSELLYYPHDASGMQRFLFPDYIRSIGACPRVGRPGQVAERAITPSGFAASPFIGGFHGDGCYQTSNSLAVYESVDFNFPARVFQSFGASDAYNIGNKTVSREYPYIAGSRLFTS